MARYALVIGIAYYKNFRSLPKAAHDAEAIARVLEQHDYRVTRLPSRVSETNEDQWTIDPHKSLSLKRLSKELKEFFGQRAKDQEVVVYIAGHGLCVRDDLDGDLQRYFALSDADEDCKDSNSVIAFDKLSKFIGQAELSSLVLLIDCCYAGNLVSPKHILESTPQAVSWQRDACLIAACQDFERAREGQHHGIFTAAVLEGLKAENAVNGETTSNHLFSFVARRLKASGQEVTHTSTGRDIVLFQHLQPAPKQIVVSDVCPYQGLKPFDSQTAQFFFGRDQLVSRMINQLQKSRIVPVIGASGSGKSSAVKAGLIPKLEAQEWRVLRPVQPGHDPISSLIQVLENYLRQEQERYLIPEIAASIEAGDLLRAVEHLPGDGPILIFVDQFEEVFAICCQHSRRKAFIHLLTQVVSRPTRLSIVMTMRADFFEDCLAHGELARIIESWQILAMPMDEGELIEAIVEPARRQGYQLEEGLLGRILRHIGAESDCLPLLQFALTELWQRRDTANHRLTVAQYEEIGGLTGALNSYANELYEELTESQQDWAKRICLQLVRTSDEIRDTRQGRGKQELLSMQQDGKKLQGEISFVLQKLIDRRLLVTDKDPRSGEAQINLAHEALMKGWKRFEEWRQEDRELRRLRDRLDDEFDEWIAHDKSDEFLMAGGRLTQVSRRWQALKADLSPEVREFYQLSYLREQANSSFQEKVDEFKASLNELQAELTERVASIDKSTKNNGSENNEASQKNYEENLHRLQNDIYHFLTNADRFQERLQASQQAAIWLIERRDSLLKLMTQAILRNRAELLVLGINLESADTWSLFQQDLITLMDWLIDSLQEGRPLVKRLDGEFFYPRKAYARAFEMLLSTLKTTGMTNKASQEFQLQLEFLINYLRYVD